MNINLLSDISFVIFIISLIFVSILVLWDKPKNKKIEKYPFISFIIPSYNDGETVGETIKSIFNSYNKENFELFVINDNSTDNTTKVLNDLKKKYKINIIQNKSNLGKVKSINDTFHKTKGELIFIVDADMHINPKAIESMLIKLTEEKVGATTCRYIPINKGFLPVMQKVEYAMLSMTQRSHNHYSTPSLWGGCILIRRDVFLQVGLLSENAIVEDGDLALKIYESGWKAKESSEPIETYVPNKLKVWYKQKKRWAAGGFQNFYNHPKYFLTHPIPLFFIFTFILLNLTFVLALINNILAIKNFYILFDSFRDAGNSFIHSVGLTKILSGASIFKTASLYLFYPLFSIPYIIYNFKIKQNPLSFLLIFPFSIIYIPMYAVVSVIGFFKGVHKVTTSKRKSRGW